jgi:hypothetical protein
LILRFESKCKGGEIFKGTPWPITPRRMNNGRLQRVGRYLHHPDATVHMFIDLQVGLADELLEDVQVGRPFCKSDQRQYIEITGPLQLCDNGLSTIALS